MKHYAKQSEYKGNQYMIVLDPDFSSVVVIAGGREVCYGTSVVNAENKFKAMVDTGWKG